MTLAYATIGDFVAIGPGPQADTPSQIPTQRGSQVDSSLPRHGGVAPSASQSSATAAVHDCCCEPRGSPMNGSKYSVRSCGRCVGHESPSELAPRYVNASLAQQRHQLVESPLLQPLATISARSASASNTRSRGRRTLPFASAAPRSAAPAGARAATGMVPQVTATVPETALNGADRAPGHHKNSAVNGETGRVSCSSCPG
jgi:hypothetical protein